MQTEQFVTFQKFNDPVSASELEALLTEHHIEFVTENSNTSLIIAASVDDYLKEITVKIKKEDFEKVDAILLQRAKEEIEMVDKDYPLLNFTDDELFEVIEKRDEWSRFDFVLAQKLLTLRGKEVHTETIQKLNQERIENLSQPEDSPRISIFGSYALTLLLGFPGIFIGSHLYSHKRTLPNGEVVKSYSEMNRKHGLIILWLGIFLSVCVIIFNFTKIFLKH